MTSRERVLAALNHQEPDRVPFDLGSTVVSGIHQPAYLRLLKELGESERELLPVLDIKQQLATPHEDILNRLGVDVIGLLRCIGRGDEARTDEDDEFCYMYDTWGIGWRMRKAGGLYYDMFTHPLAGATLDEARAYPWPEPVADLDLAGIEQAARELNENTDKAIIVHNFGSGILELYLWLLGFEYGFMSLAIDKPLAGYVLGKLTEIKVQYDEAVLPLVGEYAHIFYEADDIADQTGPLLSPEMLREMIIPLHKQQNENVKRLAPHLKIFYHTDGAVFDLIPDLIECGVDILNPVQVTARGMDDTARLKREFGADLTFWGGVDTQQVMPRGTPQEVKDQVKRRIDDVAPGGGYVLNTVHNIQGDVPPGNIVALVEALAEYGWD